MKHVLFISRSRLSQNLFQAVLTLVPFKVTLSCADSLEEVITLESKRKSFALVVMDWNVLKDQSGWEESLQSLLEHASLKAANWVLIHPHQAEIPKNRFPAARFKAFHSKPFLTEELAGTVEQWAAG